jgi:hypothetical protein
MQMIPLKMAERLRFSRERLTKKEEKTRLPKTSSDDYHIYF